MKLRRTYRHTKTLLVFLGLTLAGASFASCSHDMSPKEANSSSPAPQKVNTFVSVKSDR